VILLAYDARELNHFLERHGTRAVDRVFSAGDVRILLAIVKYVEDRWNVAHDSGEMGVQTILVIEDNGPLLLVVLPMIYAEVMQHAHRLVPEGVNLSHKLLRIQARPKIVLSSTFEDAWADFEVYQENVLGVISDIEFR